MEIINQSMWLCTGIIGSVILLFIVYKILKLVALFKISNKIDKLNKIVLNKLK